MPQLLSLLSPFMRSNARGVSSVLGGLLAVALVTGAAPSARAQESNLPDCFGSAPSGSAAAFLGTSFAPRDACEYSLERSRGYRSLSGGRTTFLAALGQLGWRSPQLPVLYGRPRTTEPTATASPLPPRSPRRPPAKPWSGR